MSRRLSLNSASSDTQNLKQDKDIIIVFYAKVKRWIKKNPDHDIAKPRDLKSLWGEYIDSLPTESLKERARKLSHVVINESQTLSENFTYPELLKAIFLLAIPDLLMLKHLDIYQPDRASTYDSYANNTYKQQDNQTYLLTPERMQPRSAFVKFTIQSEIKLNEASQLNSFSEYFNALEKSTIETFRAYSLKSVKYFIENIYPLLENADLKKALEAADISITDQITILHELNAYCIQAYALEKYSSSLSEKEEIETEAEFESESIKEQRELKALKTAQINSHTDVAFKLNYKFFFDPDAEVNPIRQYEVNAMQNIKAGTHSIAQSTKLVDTQDRKNYVYKGITELLKARGEDDDMNLRSCRESLGMIDQQNYTDFSPREHKVSYACTELPSSISDDDLLMHFFLDNIELLRNLDELENKDIVNLAMTHCWQSFIGSKQCTSEIKERNIVLTKSPAFLVVINVISEICRPNNIDGNVAHAFSKLLSKTAKDGKTQLLIALSKTLPCDSNEENETTETADKIIKLMQGINKQVAAAMLNINASRMSDSQKLESIVACASIKNSEASETTFTAYNNLQTILKKYNEINESKKIDKKSLPILIAQYENELERTNRVKSEGAFPSLQDQKNIAHIVSAINKKCTRENLENLATQLKKFSVPGQAFFGSQNTASSLQEIIDMISGKKYSAFYILLELKKKTQHIKASTSIDSLVSEVYHVVNGFFSKNNTKENNTMDSLLNRISQIGVVVVAANANLSGVSTFNQGPK